MTVERELHIPVTDFRNTAVNTDSKDIINGKYITDIPENISLPLKGLSFNNLYPDEQSYSLYEETRMTAVIPEKQQINRFYCLITGLKIQALDRLQVMLQIHI